MRPCQMNRDRLEKVGDPMGEHYDQAIQQAEGNPKEKPGRRRRRAHRTAAPPGQADRAGADRHPARPGHASANWAPMVNTTGSRIDGREFDAPCDGAVVGPGWWRAAGSRSMPATSPCPGRVHRHPARVEVRQTDGDGRPLGDPHGLAAGFLRGADWATGMCPWPASTGGLPLNPGTPG